MISSYLWKFVENNLRVIIPNIGAFLRKNNANTSFEAPIIFSPFLRFNDGLLETLVAAEEHITKEAATEKVRDFIQDMLKAIAGKRSFYVEKLGVFYQDERGAVQFIYAETESDGNRKFNEIMAKAGASNVPLLESEENEVKVYEAHNITGEKPIEKATEEEQGKPTEKAAADKPMSVADEQDGEAQEGIDEKHHRTVANAESNGSPHDIAKEKAQQLNAANNSLERWMEKRKNDAAKRPEEITPPEENTKGEEEKPDNAHPTPDVQEEAAPAADEKTNDEQQEQAEQELKRRRQEAIERALAEKTRKMQERLEEEALQKRQQTSSSPEDNGAPFTPGTWEEDVMGRRKSSNYGAWIFLVAMLFVFVAGALTLLYWTPISDFFSKKDKPEVEYKQPPLPVSPPVQTNNPQNTPAAAPARQPEAYYIVAAAFNLESTAHAFSKKLYETKKVRSEVVATSDGKFAVSLNRYGSLNAARKDVNLYKKRHGNVWIAY